MRFCDTRIIIKVSVSLTYLNLDNSGYHKNLIQ